VAVHHSQQVEKCWPGRPTRAGENTSIIASHKHAAGHHANKQECEKHNHMGHVR
jgi:hypothetical protein